MAISAPIQHKYKLIIKFYNVVFGLSQNRHLKQTAVNKCIFKHKKNKIMREIKFRVWIDSTLGDYMAVQGTPDLENLSSFMHHYSDCKNLMQYTGLKDKNGKEIYEGDILSNQYSKKDLVVFFENGFFGKSKTNQTTYNPLCNGYLKNKEIIGNIYENPELLKSSE